MEQQSTEDVKPKITRSKARHLRRKRLIIARRAADNNSLLTASDKTSGEISWENEADTVQDSTDELTKSKARRLRKKKLAEISRSSNHTSDNSISDSDNQKSLDSSDCQINVLESEGKFGQNFCGLQLNAVKSLDSLPSLPAVKGEGIFKYNFEVVSNSKGSEDAASSSLEKNSTFDGAFSEQNYKAASEQDNVEIDTSKIIDACTKILSGIDYQLQETIESQVALRSDRRQTDVDSSTDTNLGVTESNRFKTELYEIDSESFLVEDLSSGFASFVKHRAYDQQCYELTGGSDVVDAPSETFDANADSVEAKLVTDSIILGANKPVHSQNEAEFRRKDKEEKRKKSKSKSSDREAGKQDTQPETSKLRPRDIILEQDLYDAELHSKFIDSSVIKSVGSDDILGPIAHAANKPVLNSTELLENQKNLKISGSPKPLSEILRQERVKVEQESIVTIDLTNDSTSDFIINNDSESRKIEEQRIIIDLISDSSSNLVQAFQADSDVTGESSKSDLTKRSKKPRKSTAETLAKLSNLNPEVAQANYINAGTTEDDKSSTLFEATTSWAVKSEIPEDTNPSSGSLSSIGKPLETKMGSEEKTRDQVKAEREAKKAAKAAAKAKGKTTKPEMKTSKTEGEETPAKTASTVKIPVDVKPDAVEKEIESLEVRLAALEIKTVSSTDCRKGSISEMKIEGKSKAELRAERRAKQETQRAAKEKQLSEKKKPTSSETLKAKAPPKLEDPVRKIVKKAMEDENPHEVKLFKHLYHARELSLVNVPTLNSNVHPAIVRLGVQYANKVIVGSNARCVALLAAVIQLVQDFERPSQADFTRGLEASLQECAAYLHHCRPLAVSMQNALRHLKWQMTQLPATISDDEAKNKLCQAIDKYIEQQIQLAGVQISNTIQTKISNGDVILTYGYSSLIHKILIDAHKAGRQFRVVIVDGRPWLEGKEQLRRLAKQGIECSYVLINALSFIMPEASKVFLGAHAILANGAVMSRVGTAQVALMAKAFNVPVVVACETHKSSERVQTDSFVYNEIGDADELTQNLLSKSKKSPLANWRTKKSLNLLNIMYDVTPADLVTAVVTELAILPCTSVPVILRIKPSET